MMATISIAFSPQLTSTRAWFTSRTRTIPREQFWMPTRLTASSIGCRRTSSPCWMRPIAIMPNYFAAESRLRVLARAGVCAPGTPGGGAAHFFQGARTGRAAGWLWYGPGRVDGLFRAHETGIHGFVAWPRRVRWLHWQTPTIFSERWRRTPPKQSLLTVAIADMGIRVTPTWTNFLFCRVGEDAGSLCRALQDDGVIVRHMSGSWGAPDAFRVTVGTPEQNQQFLGALKRAVSRIPA